MKQFFADWRNIALAVAGIIILLLGGLLMKNVVTGSSTTIATVGDKVITEKDLVTALKARIGDQLLFKMIADALVESYASQQGVTVSDTDVDQLLDYQRTQMAMQGQSLDQALQQQGMTIEDLRKEMRIQVLGFKLVVPERDIEAAIKKNANVKTPPYYIPAQYTLRQLTFMDDKTAQKAYALLQKPDGFKDAAKLAQNADSAQKEIPYTPMPDQKPSLIDKTLQALKPGQCSKPIEHPAFKSARIIIQLVKATKGQRATVKNGGILIAQQLVQSDSKYQQEQVNLEAKALSKVDWQFYNAEYQKVHDRLIQMKKENQDVPTQAPNVNIPELKDSGASTPGSDASAPSAPPKQGK